MSNGFRNLKTKFYKEFSAAKSIPWVTTESGRLAGGVRSAGGGGFTAGNVTFVDNYQAGSVHNLKEPTSSSVIYLVFIVPSDTWSHTTNPKLHWYIFFAAVSWKSVVC